MHFVDSLHEITYLKKGEYFLEYGKRCSKIGQVTKGVLRGFIYDNKGNEVTTNFYQEENMLLGNYIANVNSTVTIETSENCLFPSTEKVILKAFPIYFSDYSIDRYSFMMKVALGKIGFDCTE